MLNCNACGLTNRPYDADCAQCRAPLQDRAAADAKRREWDALSPNLREEQERVFDKMRDSTEAHLLWLRKHRTTHAVLGGLLVSLLMNLSVGFASIPSIPVDLILGAAVALYLNRLRGGAWQGFGLFLGAAVLSLILMLPFINIEVYLTGYWFFTCFAVLAVSGGGYFMGMKLDSEHHDHFVTG